MKKETQQIQRKKHDIIWYKFYTSTLWKDNLKIDGKLFSTNCITFVSDFRQIGGFLRVLSVLQQKNWLLRYYRNITESGDKHHNTPKGRLKTS
jgi:hypothetical protein